MSNLNLVRLKKLVGVALLILPFYQMVVALQDIFFVLPKLNIIDDLSLIKSLQLQLFKKAVVISTGLLFDSAYGLQLLIKHQDNPTLSIVLGILLFIVSQVLFRLSAINQLILGLHFLPLT